MYALKNVMHVSLQVNSGGAIPTMRRAVEGENFITKNNDLDFIYIDMPASQVPSVRKALTQVSNENPQCPQNWNTGYRSRGCTKDFPRETIVGQLTNNNDFQSKAISKLLIAHFLLHEPDLDVFIGRQSMFGNKHSVIFDGNSRQLGKLTQLLGSVSLGEVIMVNPGKALCNPFQSADVIARALTQEDSLHANTFRYRKSGPKEGDVFCRAIAIREHIAAKKKKQFAARQPGPEAEKLNRQVLIEVLSIDAYNHEDIPEKIMNKVSEIHSVTLTRQGNTQLELAYGEWMPVQRDGRWGGRILLLCPLTLDLTKLFRSIHGRAICLNGVCKSLAVSSPVEESLASRVFNAAQAAAAATAAAAASQHSNS